MRVQVRRRKAGTILGEPLEIFETDNPRREPFCRHFGTCGGCTTQDLEYAAQLALKEQIVTAAFRESGLVDELPVLSPIIPAPRERQYRNKLEFSFGAQRWLTDAEVLEAGRIEDRRGFGFHAPGRFDRVLHLSECHLQPDPSEAIRSFLSSYVMEREFTFYDAREHRGVLRLLIVRTALTGDVMVTVMFGEEDPAVREQLMGALARRFPEISSLNYVVNTTKNDSIYDHEVKLWSGDPYITERCGSVMLRIRPKAFYQTNSEQAVSLYRTALGLAGLESTATGAADSVNDPTTDISGFAGGSGPLVFDLYSGIGSIALSLADRVGRVVGIESNDDAVRAAGENAELNGIENAIFERGEVESILPRVIDRHGSPDLVVVDPPRAGMHPRARRALRDLAAPRIVYISCNPRTQASDVRELIERYRIAAVQPVDMFPQTRHVENVLLLERRER